MYNYFNVTCDMNVFVIIVFNSLKLIHICCKKKNKIWFYRIDIDICFIHILYVYQYKNDLYGSVKMCDG